MTISRIKSPFLDLKKRKERKPPTKKKTKDKSKPNCLYLFLVYKLLDFQHRKMGFFIIILILRVEFGSS